MKVLRGATLRVNLLALVRIPLLFSARPAVMRLDESGCVVRIKLRRRTRNHLGSMYFGALCIGADCAGGLIAWNEIERSGRKIALIFKDFSANFLKRPDQDVYFISDDGQALRALVKRAAESDERVEEVVTIEAAADPDRIADTRFATFRLTISLKRRT